jgi:hypothetical protein
MLKCDSGCDARSRIFPVEFTELPLPGQHPERIANFRPQAATKVERPGPRLEAIERDDSRQTKYR